MISIGAFLLNVSQSSGELSVYETSRISSNTAIEYLKDDLRMTGYRTGYEEPGDNFRSEIDSARVEVEYCPDDADDCDSPSDRRRTRWLILEGEMEDGVQKYRLERRIIGPSGEEQRRITVSHNLSENSRFFFYDSQGNDLGDIPDKSSIRQIGLFIETFPREQYGDGAIRTRVETTIVPPNLNL